MRTPSIGPRRARATGAAAGSDGVHVSPQTVWKAGRDEFGAGKLAQRMLQGSPLSRAMGGSNSLEASAEEVDAGALKSGMRAPNRLRNSLTAERGLVTGGSEQNRNAHSERGSVAACWQAEGAVRRRRSHSATSLPQVTPADGTDVGDLATTPRALSRLPTPDASLGCFRLEKSLQVDDRADPGVTVPRERSASNASAPRSHHTRDPNLAHYASQQPASPSPSRPTPSLPNNVSRLVAHRMARSGSRTAITIGAAETAPPSPLPSSAASPAAHRHDASVDTDGADGDDERTASDESASSGARPRPSSRPQLLVLAAVLVLALALGGVLGRRHLMRAFRQALAMAQRQPAPLRALVYSVLFVVLAALEFPAWVLSIGAGALFGFWFGLVLALQCDLLAALVHVHRSEPGAQPPGVQDRHPDAHEPAVPVRAVVDGDRYVTDPRSVFSVGTVLGILPGVIFLVYTGSQLRLGSRAVLSEADDVVQQADAVMAGSRRLQLLFKALGLAASLVVVMIVSRLAHRAIREEMEQDVGESGESGERDGDDDPRTRMMMSGVDETAQPWLSRQGRGASAAARNAGGHRVGGRDGAGAAAGSVSNTKRSSHVRRASYTDSV
eukprot:ctg_348.g258